MTKKKKRRQGERPKQKPTRQKRIKESDLYYSQVVAPLDRQLRRAQLTGHHQVIDEVWGDLQEAIKQHRILNDRGTFVARP